MALATPRAHLVQTALGDTIWTLPAVADNAFVMKELRRVRGFYGRAAEEGFVAVEPYRGAKDRDVIAPHDLAACQALLANGSRTFLAASRVLPSDAPEVACSP